MSLTSKFGGYFRVSVRQRANQYIWSSSVRIDRGSAREVRAIVRGSDLYDVTLVVEEGQLRVWCDCPYFTSEGPCKHLWAVLVAAEKKGYLADALRANGLVADEDNLDVDADDFDDEDEGDENEEAPFQLRPPDLSARTSSRLPPWQARLTEVLNSTAQVVRPGREWPAKRQIVYFIDVDATVAKGCLTLVLATRDRKVNGEWGRTVPLDVRRSEIGRLPDEVDREVLSSLGGGIQYYDLNYGLQTPIPATTGVEASLAARIIPVVTKAGRCYLHERNADSLPAPLVWDESGEWKLKLEIKRRPRGWALNGVLRRGEERVDLAHADLVLQGGFVFINGKAAPLASDTPFEWIRFLRTSSAVEAPAGEGEELLATLLNAARIPDLEVPEELRFEEISAPARPCLRIAGPESQTRDSSKLRAQLSFDYGGSTVRHTDPAAGVYNSASRQFLRRDAEAERAATDLLGELGIRYHNDYYREPAWEISPSKLPRIVRTLVESGWHVEADGKTFRKPGEFRLEVSSGLDWFELHGEVEYGDSSAKLPELLEALRKGETMVRLGDGAYGVLPEEWLKRIGLVAGLGEAADGHMRFRRNQAGLLDVLLAAQPEARFDETFSRIRQELAAFSGIEAVAQPKGFVGQLRDYQREGLGWMNFLQRFSFGGCLADDMGVGKTAQVLALLETRRAMRQRGENISPSLVIVPKSLVFNWKQEAARFTPKLRVRDYTGMGRTADFSETDLVITTYGTLRRDIVRLKDVAFDYVILDEAQAVKNAGSESAKAVRLLNGSHRLAMSGTPVENHLGELWALFEFLNPGMLGAASVFKLSGGAGRNPDEETRKLLAMALRPFILRRTKDQVARELPPRTEQTIYCELEPAQRKLYNELRQHYRDALLKRIETEGLKKSSIQVLEALLRLRQAACHPGLIDKKRLRDGSAKLDTLLDQLREVLEEGHKALVFSQFTSLLDIVRKKLEGTVEYEYLDGATRDREERVARFQNDPECRLFLVSLKAGGVGLNLTAAEYVFLLDPWWNPAVEAQAVDRAHRIGQTRQVFAYRLIAKDTVEEKVLELQKSKRELASSIISADNSLIRNLRREDLEMLLS
ncbi:MAG TPA: SNF2-related protein [Bryobacteraceae bacterium]|nr:SNF2-related protein [Bryobacteraceae bacterium]